MSSFWSSVQATFSSLYNNACVALPSLPPAFHLPARLSRKLAQVTSALLLSSVIVQHPEKEWLRWCGKHYEAGSSADDPGGQWIPPKIVEVPLLDFRCIPAEQPYLQGETQGSFVIDVSTSWTLGQPLTDVPIQEEFLGDLRLTAFASSGDDTSPSILLFNKTISAPFVGLEIDFDLSSLQASPSQYNITCSAQRLDKTNQTFVVDSTLRYLPPNPYGGSTVKLDRRTGGLLVQEEAGWVPLFPTGYYTVYSGDEEKDHALLDEMVAKGFNTLHVIPPDSHVKTILDILRYAETTGLYIMLDLRHAYRDKKLVREAALALRSSKRLLLWYTADEPDGTQDPFDDVTSAYDQLYALDGYHPVSLVLNCGDYHFRPYTKGTDIVLVDPYPFNNDKHWSSQYGTVCNSTYGDCGCDNCFDANPVLDITKRLKHYARMRASLGRERNLTMWLVPQAFSEGFWTAMPTPDQFVVSAVEGMIHGVKGVLPWNAPTSKGIDDAFGTLAGHVRETVSPFVLSSSTVVLEPSTSPKSIDARAWVDRSSNRVLVLVANPTEGATQVKVTVDGGTAVELPRAGKATDVFDPAKRVWIVEGPDGELEFQSELKGLGTGAWLLEVS